MVSPRQGSSFLLIPQISLHLMLIPLGTHNVPPPVPKVVYRNREDSLAPGDVHIPRILDQMHSPVLQMAQWVILLLGIRGCDYGSGPNR